MKVISWSIVFLAASLAQCHGGQNKALMCYFGSWSTYRWSFGHFDVEDIDPFLCTHLVFGFAGLDQNNFRLISLDPFNDLYDNWGKGAYQRFTDLKTINPQLKTLLAIGGWNEGATKYSQMVSDPAKRSIFIQSALEMVLEHNFDGLDLDWEYPGGRSDSPGKPEDKENFAKLLREMRPVFDRHGLLLTAAVSAGKNTIDQAYDVTTMSETLDFINVMTYDFHGWWADHDYTGHNSPLYPRPEETQEDHPGFGLSTDFAMRYWRSKGAAPEKLLLGMGAYGRGFNLVNPSNNGLYAPASSGIDAAMYTSAAGFWGYNEYCEKMLNEQSQWTLVKDDYVVAPYAINGRKWFGFDDESSVRTKSQYILDQGYGGGMVWSIDTDDFHGFCTGKKFGLIATIKEVLQGNSPQPTVQPTMPTEPTEGELTTKPNQPTTVEGSTTTWTTPSNPLTTSTSNSDDDNDICGNTAGMKPDPDNCQRYYVCVPGVNGEWILHHGDCPIGLHFDSKGLFCNWPGQANCQVEAKKQSPAFQFTCPGNGWFSDGVCSPHFYECVSTDNSGHFIAYEFYCPAGTVFDNILLVCNYPWLVSECEEHSTRPSTLGPLPPSNICHRIGLNENPYEDCSSFYYDCQLNTEGDDWIVNQLKCDQGLIFDSVTLSCTAPENSDECEIIPTTSTTTTRTTTRTTTTTTTSTTTREPGVCHHPGLNPDPNSPRDCSIYYACKPAINYPDHWLITKCHCPEGLGFDPDLEVCTWPSTLDDCQSVEESYFSKNASPECTARILY